MEFMKSVASNLVAELDVDTGNTRVGYHLMSSGAFHLNSQGASTSSVQETISEINFISREGDQTLTQAALWFVRTQMFTAEAGDRPDQPNVVVVVTDGVSSNPTVTQVSIIMRLRYSE